MAEAVAAPITGIVIRGKRWFNRAEGNTYFSAEIIVNGEEVHKIDYDYGYGDQYLTNAFDWLDKNGLIERNNESGGTKEAPWRWAARLGINLDYYAEDVKRKKHL